MRARQSSVDSLSVEQTRLFPVVHIRLFVSLYGQGFYFLEYMAERLGPDLLCPPVSQRSEPQYSPFQRFCSIRTYTRSVAAARLLLLFSLLPKYLEMVSIGSLNGLFSYSSYTTAPVPPPNPTLYIYKCRRGHSGCSRVFLSAVVVRRKEIRKRTGASVQAHCHFLSKERKKKTCWRRNGTRV